MKLHFYHRFRVDNTDEYMNRFANQCSLKGFGILEQQKLQNASALVVGIGGLGCPFIQAISAAGIGKIGLVDGDKVGISNLNRQILFGIQDVGKQKVAVAKDRLINMYDHLEMEVFNFFLKEENVIDIFSSYDIIIDCTDNFEARYLISDACKKLQKPLIMGAVFEYEAQIFAFTSEKLCKISNYYRDVFPEPPKPNEVPTCVESGVLGALTGVVGNIMAFECIQYFVSVISHNKLINYNLQNGEMYNLSIIPKVF